MANFFEHKDRNALPSFRSLKKTNKIGDLNSSLEITKSVISDSSHKKIVQDWSSNKNIGVAADLLSSGIMINSKQLEVISAARFVLESDYSNSTQKELALSLLSDEIDIIKPTKDLKWFLDNNKTIPQKISHLKKKIIERPDVALNHVEISRLYLLIGEKEKSIKHMKISLFLGIDNRFILRSAVRLFSHFKEFDLAYDYVRRYKYLQFDPWLLPSEIILADIRDKHSVFAKKAFDVINSNRYTDFSKSELRSTLGTIELKSGKNKNSRSLFRDSLKNPNANSLAQVEWATSKVNLSGFDPNNYDKVDNKFEAISLDSFNNDDWDNTISHAEKWFIDSPFSKDAVLLGSHVALSHLDDYDKSIEFCSAGIISHPNDPSIINNLAYSLAMANRIDEAEKLIRKINLNHVLNDRQKYCLIATKGLIEFRKGNAENGKNHYLKVIQETSEKKILDLSNLALVNLTREEFLQNNRADINLLNMLKQMNIPDYDKSLKSMRDKVLALMNLP